MRAMVIDKLEICRSGFKSILESNFDSCYVCEADSIEEALRCLDDHHTDLIILNVDEEFSVSDPDFIRLREFAHKMPIVVVGETRRKVLVNNIFKYNFKGFLDRANSKEIIVAAIQLVLAGGQYFPPEVHDADDFEEGFTGASGEKSFQSIDRLTRRQREVLRAISEGKSNKAIAEELGISPGTVKVHVSNLMKDLKAKNRTQAVSIANNLKII